MCPFNPSSQFQSWEYLGWASGSGERKEGAGHGLLLFRGRRVRTGKNEMTQEESLFYIFLFPMMENDWAVIMGKCIYSEVSDLLFYV